jgi:hypothetical protein
MNMPRCTRKLVTQLNQETTPKSIAKWAGELSTLHAFGFLAA